jgi:hypothetical protein
MIHDSEQRLAKAIIELRELVVRVNCTWFSDSRLTIREGLCTDRAGFRE